MYRPRNPKGALLRLGMAALLFYGAWEQWQLVDALESGADVGVKMFAPLAWIYNQGGAWSEIAKWTGRAGMILLGVVALLWCWSDLRPHRQRGLS